MEDNAPRTMSSDSNHNNAETMDQLTPLMDYSILDQIKEAKKSDPSKFQSFWEMDEQDINEATEEEIQNDPALKTLWAAEHGHLDIIKEVLSGNKDLVNSRDEDGYTPLHRASYENHVAVIQYLLGHGAQLHAETVDGWTALHSAANWGQHQAVAVLLSHGADINAQTNSKQTPLHLASSNAPDSLETLQLLLIHPDCHHNLTNSVRETASDLGRRYSKYHKMFDLCDDNVNKLS